MLVSGSVPARSILANGAKQFYLISSSIEVQSNGVFYGTSLDQVSGIMFYGDDKAVSYIVDSNISVTSEGTPAMAISTGGIPTTLINTQIKVSSKLNSAIAIGSLSGNQTSITFLNEASTLSVSSSKKAEPFFSEAIPLNIINNSTPASQCSINDGPSEDC